ncbi:hypothetical protein CMO93_00235 [Candidatus Woesearchaeota archaeon]|nr:hypothetical protein [Candidatus Woesearchaeota archaeon]
MISSVFGVVFFGFGSSGAASAKYNDFKFINQGDHWSTKLDGRYALFTYLPEDVVNIEVDNSAINILKNIIQIDATSDFNDTFSQSIALAQYQMGITLSNFNIFIRSGFTNSKESDFPVITCNNATQFVPVIYFKSSNETKVYLQDNCIIAEASNDRDMARVKDRLVYGILNIIE